MKIKILNNNISNFDINVYNDGLKILYKKSKHHNADGPTYDRSNGDESWWFEGKCHREYGPSFKWRMGDKWFLEGKEYTQKEFMEKFL